METLGLSFKAGTSFASNGGGEGTLSSSHEQPKVCQGFSCAWKKTRLGSAHGECVILQGATRNPTMFKSITAHFSRNDHFCDTNRKGFPKTILFIRGISLYHRSGEKPREIPQPCPYSLHLCFLRSVKCKYMEPAQWGKRSRSSRLERSE